MVRQQSQPLLLASLDGKKETRAGEAFQRKDSLTRSLMGRSLLARRSDASLSSDTRRSPDKSGWGQEERTRRWVEGHVYERQILLSLRQRLETPFPSLSLPLPAVAAAAADVNQEEGKRRDTKCTTMTVESKRLLQHR